MAIAFRSAGTRLKADIGQTGPNQSVALPAGHTAGDYLMLFVLTDDNSNLVAATPTGWTRAVIAAPGSSVQTPYSAPPHLGFFARTDNGTLGSSVPLKFNSSTWPAGSPWVIAFVVAYSGVDTTGPLETWRYQSSSSTAAAQAHPQLTTTTANDWLVHVRAVSAFQGVTVTNSAVGDAERVDDTAFNEIALALYDSAAGVAAGAQTIRTTTSSAAADYGSVMLSIALKAPSTSSSTAASPGEADVTATAYNPTVAAQDGPWELCAGGGLPQYQAAIDWSGDGSFTDTSGLGDTYAADAFGRTVAAGWGTADTGQAWTVASTASDFSVTPGNGLHSHSSLNVARTATLPCAATDLDVTADFSTPVLAAGGSLYAYVTARQADSSNFYTARVQMTTTQTMVLTIRKRVAGTETELANITVPTAHAASTWYTVRLRVVGSALSAKLWQVGNLEPAWQITATDTDLTAAALTGVRSLLGTGYSGTLPVVFSFDNFRASEPVDADDVIGDVISDIAVSYGRDQERQLAPAAIGSAAFTLNNTSRRYSPENAASPLFGDIDPARPMRAQVTWSGQTYPLFTGRIDDYSVKADFSDRTVDLSFLDGMNSLAGTPLSTGVYASMRTGALVNAVLDEAGWTGGRDIDAGASVVRFWWADGTDALSAIQDLVRSEGPPAVAYAAPDGTFVFRDRHHRMQRQDSLTPQATFHAGALGDCTDTGVPDGALSLARPFTYAHGWKDIINSVSFDVPVRAPSVDFTAVWQDTSSYTLALGQSVDLTVSSSDPFVNAITPVLGTDVVASGPGTVGVLLSRSSGASAKLTLQALGGSVTITSVQVRAQMLEVKQTIRVSAQDTGSITRHGERAYPNDAPWAAPEDARAIANMVLLHYADRRPTVQIRVVSSDPAHLVQVLSRTVSDRVRIVNEEMRLDTDCFVERVTHTIQRTGTQGRPPVHAVVLGCEKGVDVSDNPFAFDVRGAGFDQGVFDPIHGDEPGSVFVFDDPVQGQFDLGKYGT